MEGGEGGQEDRSRVERTRRRMGLNFVFRPVSSTTVDTVCERKDWEADVGTRNKRKLQNNRSERNVVTVIPSG